MLLPQNFLSSAESTRTVLIHSVSLPTPLQPGDATGATSCESESFTSEALGSVRLTTSLYNVPGGEPYAPSPPPSETQLDGSVRLTPSPRRYSSNRKSSACTQYAPLSSESERRG